MKQSEYMRSLVYITCVLRFQSRNSTKVYCILYQEMNFTKLSKKKKKTHIAAKEATHLRKEVPNPKPPSLAASLMSFLAATLSSLTSDSIKLALTSSSVFIFKNSILPIFLFSSLLQDLKSENKRAHNVKYRYDIKEQTDNRRKQ